MGTGEIGGVTATGKTNLGIGTIPGIIGGVESFIIDHRHLHPITAETSTENPMFIMTKMSTESPIVIMIEMLVRHPQKGIKVDSHTRSKIGTHTIFLGSIVNLLR